MAHGKPVGYAYKYDPHHPARFPRRNQTISAALGGWRVECLAVTTHFLYSHVYNTTWKFNSNANLSFHNKPSKRRLKCDDMKYPIECKYSSLHSSVLRATFKMIIYSTKKAVRRRPAWLAYFPSTFWKGNGWHAEDMFSIIYNNTI